MCARKGTCGIVKGPTSIKGWVRKWFYASGERLAKDESRRSFFDVPTRFGNLVSIRPVPELTQASFDTLKYYNEHFPRGRKVGTLVTDKLLLESGLLDYNPAVRPIESSRRNSELAMVCGFASNVKRKSKGRAHALEATKSLKPATSAVILQIRNLYPNSEDVFRRDDSTTILQEHSETMRCPQKHRE
ncbi:uncharacterized protein LOC111022477 [Momordica charantia]|uniref:Uncharacterized protein LOC111022477 n=1 Tax=Momordica charantia TaxID=3673 RepID=A0A6J1DMQ2_MOMCH|nr:uncharacterized protein LOC111022477 [Momordica charantia]